MSLECTKIEIGERIGRSYKLDLFYRNVGEEPKKMESQTRRAFCSKILFEDGGNSGEKSL